LRVAARINNGHFSLANNAVRSMRQPFVIKLMDDHCGKDNGFCAMMR
jgi:hypothetical protein